MLDVLTRGTADGDIRTATARWLRGGDLTQQFARQRNCEFYYSTRKQKSRDVDLGTVYLGTTEDDGAVPLGWCDDRHIVTVAGSRAGKGRSAIIPNLLLYPGSIICIDPKGENARATASHRADVLGQDVFVLDPYDTTGTGLKNRLAYYDPLAALDLRDEELAEKISRIADSMVVSSGGKDAHWDETSRAFIGALIGHVLTEPTLHRPRTLPTVRALLTGGDPDAAAHFTAESHAQGGTDPVTYEAFDALIHMMRRNTALGGMISGQAQRLISMSYEERGSVLSTSDRHTKFLEGVKIPSVLSKSLLRTRLDLTRLKTDSRPITIYLCLPARYMASHARWLRLMIGALLAEVESVPGTPASGYRILAILDEFPVLGRLQSIESAVGYMAGFGLQIWAVLQDLSQLKRDYPQSWETFLGNAGLKQFFGNTDHTTLEYIAKSLGDTEVIRATQTLVEKAEADMRQQRSEAKRSEAMFANPTSFRSLQSSEQILKTPLLTPGEIALVFRRSSRRQLLLTAETHPIVAYRRNYDVMLRNGEIDKLRNIP